MSFRDADGLIICQHCNARFSEKISDTTCPNCGKDVSVKMNHLIHSVLICERGDRCELGGPDGVCCISCPGNASCDKPCYTAETYGFKMPDMDEPKCEYMKLPKI